MSTISSSMCTATSPPENDDTTCPSAMRFPVGVNAGVVVSSGITVACKGATLPNDLDPTCVEKGNDRIFAVVFVADEPDVVGVVGIHATPVVTRDASIIDRSCIFVCFLCNPKFWLLEIRDLANHFLNGWIMCLDVGA